MLEGTRWVARAGGCVIGWVGCRHWLAFYWELLSLSVQVEWGRVGRWV